MKDILQESSYLLLLRIISAIIIVCIVFAMIFAYEISRPAYESLDISVENAYIDIGNVELDESPPLYLRGEWEYFPGVHLNDDVIQKDDLINPQTISIPLMDLNSANENATYRMHIKINDLTKNGLVFYIANPKNDINVYLNGKALISSSLNQNWLNYSRFDSVFYIKELDPNKEYQEIVVSTENANGSSGIFQRDLIISTLRNIITLTLISVGNQMMITGFILIMLISNYIFMILRPGHKMITDMTLFDSFLMMRIMFSLDSVFALINNVVGKEMITDQFCYAMQVFFLFMAGIAGMKLSHDLYDTDNKTPKILIYPPKILYLVFGIFFFIRIDIFDTIGIPILLAIFLYTFIGITYQFMLCVRTNFSKYYAFQIIKTIYVGVIILFDICFWNKSPDFLLMVLLYSLFFTIHIGFRLYDNNISYAQVEVFNRDLERTIEERTRELEESNHRLEEISIRDPLTKAYNRRYFEIISKQYIETYEKGDTDLYLALFDLDLFKRINDTYGHDEGDKQLIWAVECCNRVTGDKGILSRIGGEEFTVLFLGESGENVLQWAEILRKEFEESKKGNPKRTTVSIGLAKYHKEFDENSFYKLADTCLYNAKNTGRNKVCYNFDGNILNATALESGSSELGSSELGSAELGSAELDSAELKA